MDERDLVQEARANNSDNSFTSSSPWVALLVMLAILIMLYGAYYFFFGDPEQIDGIIRSIAEQIN